MNERALLASAIINKQNAVNPKGWSTCRWAGSKASGLASALARAAWRRGLKPTIMSTSTWSQSMRTREAAEGHDSEQSKDLLEEAEEEAAKPLNFPGQAESTSASAAALRGPAFAVCEGGCSCQRWCFSEAPGGSLRDDNSVTTPFLNFICSYSSGLVLPLGLSRQAQRIPVRRRNAAEMARRYRHSPGWYQWCHKDFTLRVCFM